MKLFVYGTLKYPEIMFALTGTETVYTNATLNGYKIVSLKNRPYPGLAISNGTTALGKLIEIDEKSYAIISAWEDVEYSPIEITVSVYSDQIKAFTFLHTTTDEQLSKIWDEENFTDNHLEDYVKNRIPKFLSHLKSERLYSQRKTRKAMI